MIAKVCKSGSSPRRLLDYLARDGKGGAKVIDHNLAGDHRRAWARQLAELNQTHRPSKGLYVKHFVLSYAPDEKRPVEELRETARHFLARMGYEAAPTVVFLHTNTKNRHLHMVTTPTTWTGEAISERYDKLRSVRIARELEERFGLERVASPESADFKAPTQREMKQTERTGEPSERSAFQFEVAQAARRAKSLPEMLERLAGRGFSTHVLLDREGQLRGISFERRGAAFKGSELGQSFRAGKILERYGLAYDPARDREAVRRWATVNDPDGRSQPKGKVILVSEDVRALYKHPARPMRELEHSIAPRRSFDLPEGRYLVAFAKPGFEHEQVRWSSTSTAEEGERLRASAAELEALRPQLEKRSESCVVLVRPMDEGETRTIGFRFLERQDVESLKRDGFEPSMVVKGGEQFDVWLRTGAGATHEEASALRRELIDRYRLPAMGDALYDAIRLPGLRTHVDGAGVPVRHLESSGETMPAWSAWREQHSRTERALLAERAVDVPYEGRPRDETSPIPTAEMLFRRKPISIPFDAGDHRPPRDEAVHQRVQDAAKAYDGARERFLVARDEVERSAMRLERTDSLAAVRDYQASAKALGIASRELVVADREYFGAVLAQSKDERARVSAALEAVGRSASDHEPLCKRTEDDAQFEAQLIRGRSPALEQPAASNPNEGSLSAARTQKTTDLEHMAELDAQRLWSEIERWRASLGERARVEERSRLPSSDPEERLQIAAERVARGNVSPEALRSVTTELLAGLPQERITQPMLPRDLEVRDHLRELARTVPQLEAVAARVAAGDLSVETQARLFTMSAEVIARFREIDAAQRAHLGVPEPSRAERHSQAVWNAAWLSVARERGLSEASAVSQLASTSRAPFETAFRVTDRVVTIALHQGLELARVASRYLHRVLEEDHHPRR